jgi:uncharacterized BrkB/YihY/UPF0761 family membrane protein
MQTVRSVQPSVKIRGRVLRNAGALHSFFGLAGKSNVASSYGAAGAFIILLLWIFYSAQIFLLGTEFTRNFSRRYGTHAGRGQ